jgi:4'-phosphopantetheinyl transferase
MLLPSGEVHLWCADPAQLVAADCAARARSLLTGEELERLESYRFERDQRIYLATHALLRSVLSRYQEVAPPDWRFSTNANGKPEIDGQSSLRFNLSNTEGLVVCALARDIQVGVDVERLSRTPPLEVARSYFAAAEVSSLEELPPHERPRRFFDYWTLKESYIKARGLGLSLPLDRFWFQLERDRPPRLVIDPALDDDGESWQFVQCAPTADHLVAVCIRRSEGRDATLLLHWHQFV